MKTRIAAAVTALALLLSCNSFGAENLEYEDEKTLVSCGFDDLAPSADPPYFWHDKLLTYRITNISEMSRGIGVSGGALAVAPIGEHTRIQAYVGEAFGIFTLEFDARISGIADKLYIGFENEDAGTIDVTPSTVNTWQRIKIVLNNAQGEYFVYKDGSPADSGDFCIDHLYSIRLLFKNPGSYLVDNFSLCLSEAMLFIRALYTVGGVALITQTAPFAEELVLLLSKPIDPASIAPGVYLKTDSGTIVNVTVFAIGDELHIKPMLNRGYDYTVVIGSDVTSGFKPIGRALSFSFATESVDYVVNSFSYTPDNNCVIANIDVTNSSASQTTKYLNIIFAEYGENNLTNVKIYRVAATPGENLIEHSFTRSGDGMFKIFMMDAALQTVTALPLN